MATSSNELALTAGAICGIAALLVHSVVDFNFHLPANALLGAMLFAIMAAPSADLATGDKPRATSGTGCAGWRPRLRWRFSRLAVPLMPGEYYGELSRRAFRDRKYEEARTLAERAVELREEESKPVFLPRPRRGTS